MTGSIAITDTVAVKATFSGTRDVQKEAIAFRKGKKSDPVEIAGELECGGETARFKLSANGVYTFHAAPPEELLEAVRKVSVDLQKPQFTPL